MSNPSETEGSLFCAGHGRQEICLDLYVCQETVVQKARNAVRGQSESSSDGREEVEM